MKALHDRAADVVHNTKEIAAAPPSVVMAAAAPLVAPAVVEVCIEQFASSVGKKTTSICNI